MTSARAIREVARRELLERSRSRAMRVSFAVLLALVVASAVVATLADGGTPTDDFGLEMGHFMTKRAWGFLASVGVTRIDDGWKRTDACVHLPLGTHRGEFLPRKSSRRSRRRCRITSPQKRATRAPYQ